MRTYVLLMFLTVTLSGTGVGLAAEVARSPGDPISRIKDIATVEGVRDNQLMGYGLVIGLAGTGDSDTGFTQESISTMMRRLGVPVDANAVNTQSIAAVMVTAKLPPFVRPGSTIDVKVSTLGDCQTLQGGTLLPVEMRGFDGRVHAIAQGALSIGGVNAGQGGGAGGLKLNHPTVATIPSGGVVEGQPVPTNVLHENYIRFQLHDPDFVTANRMKDVINAALADRAGGETVAVAVNAGVVQVNVLPLVDQYDSLVQLIAEIEHLPVQSDGVARVVINERTGTVVMGHNVRIAQAAVSHHDFTISFTRTEETVAQQESQVGEISGQPLGTIVTEEMEISEDQGPPFRVVDDSTTVEDLIDTLNALKVKPRDMIAILQALRRAGALKAELVIL